MEGLLIITELYLIMIVYLGYKLAVKNDKLETLQNQIRMLELLNDHDPALQNQIRMLELLNDHDPKKSDRIRKKS